MSMAGGPAALKGFLYQLLQHIGHLADAKLQVDAHVAGDAICELVFEPADGGDARVRRGVSLIVEQYKSRQSTFGVSDIESALADLRKAARPEFGDGALYRIVTDARPGRIDTFIEFNSAIRTAASPEALDDGKPHRIGSFEGSHRAYFEQLRGGASGPKLFHVLRQLQLDFGVDSDTLVRKLQKRLGPFALEAGAERQVVDRLLGMLLVQLAKGSLELDAAGVGRLLESVGLNADRVTRAARMPQALATLARERLAHIGYDRSRDVRSPEALPNAQVLVYAAPSGTGKTWSLARTLLHHAEAGQPTSFLVGARSVEEVLNAVASDVWHVALGETTVRPWRSIRNFMAQLDAPEPIMVGLDDVQDMALAREIAKTNWSEHGIRIVMAVSERVARSLASNAERSIDWTIVREFSVDELDRYLHLHGHRWADLPPDLKRLLRRPILAHLYVSLGHASFRTAPRGEYEIFEAFWKRIAAVAPGDEGLLLGLADHFRGVGVYPLPRSQWPTLGFDTATVERLVASGWLQLDADGAVSFAHERFLNWAVAHNIANAYCRGQVNAEETALRATGDNKEFGNPVYRRLGYVPMDLLWMCTAPGIDPAVAAGLLARLDATRTLRDEIYDKLVPTLGDRVVPHLLARARMAAAEVNQHVTHGIAQALAAIGAQDGSTAADAAAKLLGTEEPTLIAVALRVLAKRPVTAVLDELWQVHQGIFRQYEEGSDYRRYRAYEASSAAMRAAVETQPAWLRKRIIDADPAQEPVSELGYLLFNMQSEEANDIWRDAGSTFAAKIPVSKARSLMLCLARFGGAEDVEHLVQRLDTREDWGGASAFMALCCIDPDRAVRELPCVREHDAYLSRNQWMPMLLHAAPVALSQELLDLARAGEGIGWIIESLFEQYPDDMPVEVMCLLLQHAQRRLAQFSESAANTDFFWLTRSLDLVTRMSRPELLDVLQGDEGRALSEWLLRTAHRRDRTNSRVHDHLGESIKKFMAIVAADHLEAVIVDELASPHYWVRHSALRWAFFTRSTPIASRLVRIAVQAIEPGRDSQQPDEQMPSNAALEFHLATTALAGIGADSELMRVLDVARRTDVSRELAVLRRFQGSMDPTLSRAALAELRSDAGSGEALVRPLLVAWLAGDCSFIPAIEAVFARAEPGGLVARFCCIALSELKAQGERLVPLAARMLVSKENTPWALDLLIEQGEPGVPTLRKWVESGGAKLDAARLDALRALMTSSESDFVRRTANALFLSDRSLFNDIPYDLLDPVSDPVVLERLIEDAFTPAGTYPARTLGAIKALGMVDAERAVHACLVRLEASAQYEAHLCRLALELAPDAGPGLLLQVATDIPRLSLTDEVGRALRRARPAAVAAALGSYLRGSVAQRRLAAEVATWCLDDAVVAQLEAVVASERVPSIRNLLFTALLRRGHDEFVLALFERFRKGNWKERWSALTSILEVGDPFLLAREGDTLWCGNILGDDVPAIFLRHANETLQRLQDALSKSRSGTRARE